MNRVVSLVALVVAAVSGACFDPQARAGLLCSETERCPPGLTCVSGRCFAGAPPSDAGCANACGDVNDDGDVNAADTERLNAVVAGEESLSVCGASVADVDGDGQITAEDASLTQRIAEGSVVGGCRACEDACADPDLSGERDVVDVDFVGAVAAGERIADVCEYLNSDINRSGIVESRDAHLLGGIVLGRVEPVCEACAGLCGDVNQSGVVNISDSIAAVTLSESEDPIPLCIFDAADVNSDLLVNSRDTEIIVQIVAGNIADGCTPCTNVCGDVNQDGAVTNGDAVIANQWAMGMFQVPLTACGFDAADLNNDGTVAADDAQAILDATLISAVPTCSLAGE